MGSGRATDLREVTDTRQFVLLPPTPHAFFFLLQKKTEHANDYLSSSPSNSSECIGTLSRTFCLKCKDREREREGAYEMQQKMQLDGMRLHL